MKKYLIILVPLLMARALYGQELNGVVKDEQHHPLAGAAIIAVVNKASAISQANGSFHLRLQIFPDTLRASCIGYAPQQIVVRSANDALSIVLQQSNTTLQDVTIHTGYQQLKPNEVNGSYVVIDNKTLNLQTGTNILQRLNGVTSSLLFNTEKHNNNPQSATGITIRGLSTINGPLDPLIVVDNFIYDGDISNINPNDVESITVLKDAAATSIWGARAGNGVIVITTKKGKFNQKLQVGFNSDVIVTGKPDLYYQPQISSADYIGLEQFLFNKGFYDGTINSTYKTVLSPATEVFLARRNGSISAADSAAQIDALKSTDSRDAFTKYFYRQGITQQYALNLRGGSQNLAWLISGTYDKDISSLRAEYNKVNLRFENTYRPVKSLQLNVGAYYTNSNSLSGEPDYNTLTTLNGVYIPYLGLAGGNGASVAVPHLYRQGYIDTAGGGKLLDWNYYPLEDWKHNRTQANTEDIMANIGIQYHILSGLDLNLQYQYQRQRVNSRNISDTASFYTRNAINLFSQLNRQTGVVKYIVPLGAIVSQSNANEYAQNFRGQLNFDRTFHAVHKITAIAGMELRSTSNDGNSNTYYGYNADPLSYGNVDVVNYYPTFITGYSSKLTGSSYGFTQYYYRFASFFGNASYIYKQRYILSGSMRKDGSNIFGAKTNDKWKPLWSAGVGWVASKEGFYNLPWLPYLKLSATIGYSGNVDLSRTAAAVGGSGTTGATNLPFIRITQINNPELRWEQAYQASFRMEFSTPKNRLSGSLEYYHKKGTDLYGQTPYDYTTWGFLSTITKNVAAMSGNGADIILHSRNTTGAFQWNTDAWFSYNASKTTAYYTDNAGEVATFIGGGGAITPIIGKPLYALAAYRWGGLDAQGNPRGYLNDTLSEDYNAIAQSAFEDGLKGGSFKYIGPATPLYYGAIMNSFSYKGFSLSFNIQFKLHYYLFRPSLSYYNLVYSGASSADYAGRWQQAGDEKTTNVPSFVYPLDQNRDAFYNGSEINVIRGDHIRLQFINLGYTFTGNRKGRFFKTLQLYGNAANLGIIWKANKYHIDPDYVQTIPLPKSYTIGLRAGF